MKTPVNWKDHIVEHPDYYTEVNIGDGVVQHVKAPGEIIQQGTPMSASNFNDMDLGGIQGILIGLLGAQYVHQLSQKVEGLEGEQIEVTLTNTKNYPFNNSLKSVQLSKYRNSKDYTVQVEVLEKTGGGVGDILVTDKLLNGFKIAYTGAATSVKVNCMIRGGI